ncbi:MAG: T9SS type A sorting domain-containing protein [Flavobacteriales bacterium]|nr:T9SS type A sorting domain-containing protein [Flavobacteriales bacterium]
MKKPIPSLAIAATMLISPIASAQVSFGGSPVGLSEYKSTLPAAPVHVMPAVDALTLMVEDAERLAAGSKRQRFGINHATDFTLDNSGVWSTLANGDRVWRLGIECPGAFSVNFEFNTYVVPEGGQIFVYNPLGHTMGAFTAASHPGHTVLGVGLMQGDRITIEYVEPASRAGQGQLRIGQVTHGYRDSFDMAKGFGASGSCNNNVICPISVGYEDQIRSVARIVVGGGDHCTGSLLDNCAHDEVPYFMTANHCMISNPATWVFAFNWNSPACTPTTNPGMNQTVSGATELASGAGSDFALLLLDDNLPDAYNVFFSGWDKSGTAATEVRAIHHPSGDIKKFSIEEEPVITGTMSGAQCWHVQGWDDGTTEPGSSGSGLWDQNGRFVGQLFGGQASCSFNFNDFYGKFSVTFPNVSQWLGNNCGNTVDGINDIVGIEEFGVLAGVSVYPNPNVGIFTVELPSSLTGTIQLRVTDAMGRVVLDQRSSAATQRVALDLGAAAEGIYNLEVISGGARSVQRIVVQR